MSVIFINTPFAGPKSDDIEPENWLLWFIFFPALLAFILVVGMGMSGVHLNLSVYMIYIVIIFFGLLFGWLTGITIDSLIAIMNKRKIE